MCSIYLRNRSYKGENWTMKFQYFTLILSKVRSWTVFFCFLQTFIPNFAGWFFMRYYIKTELFITFVFTQIKVILIPNVLHEYCFETEKTANTGMAKWIRHFRPGCVCLCQIESSCEAIHMKMSSAYRFMFIQIMTGFARRLVLKPRQ